MRRRLSERVSGRLRRAALRLPDPPRSWVVKALPTSVVGEAMQAGASRDRRYFEELYTRDPDPYGFDRNPDEQLKFARVLELCGPPPLGRVLELGCALGTFTELLAAQSRSVLAVDISQAAVDAASVRLSAQASVTCRVVNLPDEFPDGPFDVIVASDVLYYWAAADVRRAVKKMEGALALGGAIVAAHYTPDWGAISTGDEVHDLLVSHSELSHVFEGRDEFGAGRTYRLDRYERI